MQFLDDGMNATATAPSVLVVYRSDYTFVRTDLELLRTLCEVRSFPFPDGSSYLSLVRAVWKADVVFSWFALGFSALANMEARALGKKSILVSGGWDVVRMPEIGYGNLLHRRGEFTARRALAYADLVLAFSDWSAGVIKELVPECNARRAYLGVDVAKF